MTRTVTPAAMQASRSPSTVSSRTLAWGMGAPPAIQGLVSHELPDDRSRRGLHRHPAASRDGDPGSAWLHVSAGLGTSTYAQVRLACRPEATLLSLTARG